MVHDERTMGILEQLDSGEITVEEAVTRLEGGSAEPMPVRPEGDIPPAGQTNRGRWLGVLGLILSAMIAAGGGWLVVEGGWWLLPGIPLLVLGTALMTLSALSLQSPWMQLRVVTGADRWPRRITLFLPIPLRLVSWGLRISARSGVDIDPVLVQEVLGSLDQLHRRGTPLTIRVREGEQGDKVDLSLG